MTATVIEQEEPERVAGPSRPEQQILRPPGTTVVAILDGSPMVARVLELLLQGCGYDTRLLEDVEPDRPGGLPLVDVDILVLAPGPSREHTEALLATIRSMPETAYLPVILMLFETPHGVVAEETRVLAWPCRTEELVREIEAALAATGPRR